MLSSALSPGSDDMRWNFVFMLRSNGRKRLFPWHPPLTDLKEQRSQDYGSGTLLLGVKNQSVSVRKGLIGSDPLKFSRYDAET